jgi:hypothetical protein
MILFRGWLFGPYVFAPLRHVYVHPGLIIQGSDTINEFCHCTMTAASDHRISLVSLSFFGYSLFLKFSDSMIFDFY